MTNLIADEGIEYVGIELKLRSNPASTTTVYAGLNYYGSGQIYTTNPIVYPALVDPLNGPKLEMQQYAAGVKNSISLRLRARSGYIRPTFGIADLNEDYEFHGAKVTCYYIPRALQYKEATYSTSVNVRQVLEVVGFTLNYESDELVLQCQEVWFKDRQLGRIINEDNTGLVSYSTESNADGVRGQVAFGLDTIIDAPKLDKVTGVSYDPVFRLFDGWTLSNTLRNREMQQVYASTNNVALNNRGNQRWFLLDTDFDTGSHSSSYRNTNDSFAGYYAASPTQYNTLNSNSYGQDFQPVENHLMVGASLFLKKDGTVTYDYGEFKINVYEYQDVGGSGLTSTRILASTSTDPSAVSGTGAKVDFVFDQPVLLVGGQKYFFEYVYSRHDDATNTIRIGVNLASSCYIRDETVDEKNWLLTSSIVPVSYFWALDTEGVFGAVATQWLDVTSLAPPSGFQNDFVTDENVRYKLLVDGIEDDGSGTLTGTANTILRYPAQIMLGILYGDIDNGFGLGLSGTEVDITAFRSVASSQSTDTLELSFSYDGGETAESFIRELAYYGLQWVYKGRDGKLTTKYRDYTSTPDYTFDAYNLGESLQVLSHRSLPLSTVINVCNQEYSAEYLEVVDDARRSRVDNREQLKSVRILDENDATYGSASSDSQDFYGRREHTKPLNYAQSATTVQELQEYYFRRFSTALEEVSFSLPRIFYFNDLEVLNTLQLDAGAITRDAGDNIDQTFRPGSSATTYTDGVPSQAPATNTFTGEIMVILERGLDLVVTVQTRGDYS